MKKISVIIPCYNSSDYLAIAIESALAQSYRDKEIIVIDDGSTDDSSAVMNQYGDRISVVRQANAGLPAARNAGIRASSGEWLAFLDADDWWHPDFLTKTAQALETNHAVLAYTGWQNVEGEPSPHEPFVPEDYERSTPGKQVRLLRSPGWPVHAALVSRTAVIDSGMFNPALKSCEDFDLWLRLALNQPIVRVPEVLAYYRFHPQQMTRNRARIALTHYQVQQAFLRNHPEIIAAINDSDLRKITCGELLKRGYRAYWARDLIAARAIFREVMRAGYGKPADWKYMLPAWLPEPWHHWLVGRLEKHY